MSIWDIGVQYLNNKENENNEADTTLLFVGEKSSGKSTVISKFLDKNDNSKSTVALEYLFGRSNRGHNIPKRISHVWELGGGLWLQKLIDVVISPENIKSLTLVVVVDLAEPSSIFETVEILVTAARTRIGYVVAETDKSNESTTERELHSSLSQKLEERLSVKECEMAAAAAERELRQPLMVPLVIVAGKYDKFKESSLSERTVICRTLRFLTHFYGGSLVFFTMNQEDTGNRVKSLLRHHAFSSSINKSVDTSPTNPLLVPVGMDSFSEIGLPEFKDDSSHQLPRESLIQFWKRAYQTFFPSKKVTSELEIVDPAKNPQFLEKIVDEAKKQKDAELESYRKLSNRRMRDLRQQAINDGILAI